jgi:hypothetical protein
MSTQMTDDLVKRLRSTRNWQREVYDEGSNWKDVTCVYDTAPFEAADALERLSQQQADEFEAWWGKGVGYSDAKDLSRFTWEWAFAAGQRQARAALSQQQAEPVAEVVISDGSPRWSWLAPKARLPDGRNKLYAAPPADDEAVRLLKEARGRLPFTAELAKQIDAYLAKGK